MPKARPIVLLVAVVVIVAAAVVFVQRRTPPITPPIGARVDSLQSSMLGGRRAFWVNVPAGYETDMTKRYPVLYVLDGETEAAHTIETAQALAGIPAMIVVAIPNPSYGVRDRDFTPPADWRGAPSPFVKFLEEELIPRIEGQYRTARPRILSGASRSAMFLLYSQIAAPALVDARLAFSPFVWSEEDEPTATRFEQGLPSLPSDSAFLYLSLGDAESQTTQPFQHAVRALETKAPPTLRWQADHTPQANHETNARRSLPLALCRLFAGEPCTPAAAR